MAKSRSRYYETTRRRPPWRGLSFEQNKIAAKIFLAAVERFGPAWEGGCLCTLLRGRRHWEDSCYGDPRKHLGGELCHPMEYFDHATFFQHPGQPVSAVIGQPYDFHDGVGDAPLHDFCRVHGITLTVEDGWHYPGATKALIFTLK